MYRQCVTSSWYNVRGNNPFQIRQNVIGQTNKCLFSLKFFINLSKQNLNVKWFSLLKEENINEFKSINVIATSEFYWM